MYQLSHKGQIDHMTWPRRGPLVNGVTHCMANDTQLLIIVQ